MIPTITAFKASPDRGRGMARDFRVRWALEEVGQAYDVRLVTFEEMKEAAHLARHPFGQIPTYEADGLVLFESGAIVLHIAGRGGNVLLPVDPHARARTVQWVISALNSIEPFLAQLVTIDLFFKDEEWAKLRRPSAADFVRRRLGGLSNYLGDKTYLDGDQFTAGDLMMTSVLRLLNHTDIVAEFPNLAAYVARNTARPAFQRALNAQMGDFKAAA